MIQCRSLAGGGVTPMRSSAKRNAPIMPGAGSVMVPSRSTSSVITGVSRLRGWSTWTRVDRTNGPAGNRDQHPDPCPALARVAGADRLSCLSGLELLHPRDQRAIARGRSPEPPDHATGQSEHAFPPDRSGRNPRSGATLAGLIAPPWSVQRGALLHASAGGRDQHPRPPRRAVLGL